MPASNSASKLSRRERLTDAILMMPPIQHRLWNLLTRLFGWVGAACARLFGALDFCLGWLFGRTLAASEAADGLDVVVYWMVWVGLAPFRLGLRLFRLLVPGVVRDWLWQVGQMLVASFQVFIGYALKLADWLNLDVVVYWLVWLFWPLWRPIAGGLGFLYAWIVTRDSRQVARGLPAILLLVPLLLLALRAYSNNAQASLATYQSAIEQATEAGDYATVQIFERKLAQLGGDTRLQSYNRGLSLAEEGKLDEAYGEFQKLTPLDQAGYLPARFWILQQLLEGKLEEDQASRDQAMEEQLPWLEKEVANHPLIVLARAQLLANEGEYSKSVELLRPLAVDMPFVATEILRLDILLNNADKLPDDSRRVVRYIEQKREQDRLSSNDYVYWTLALKCTGQYDELERACEQWLLAEPASEAAKANWAWSARRRIELMITDPTANPAVVAEQLVRLATIAPDRIWMERQVKRMFEAREAAVLKSTLADQIVEALLQEPDCPSEVVDTIGTQAALNEEWSWATSSFRRLTKQTPSNGSAWNNLAWVLLQSELAARELAEHEGRESAGDKELLLKALANCNQAIALQPEECRFRETRGQIHVALKKWNQAVEDLEYAMNGMPATPGIHRALAIAYRALGDENLANIHEQAAGND